MVNSPRYRYAVVLPVYNEKENLPPLVAEITDALSQVAGEAFEIVCVDDASDDGSADQISQLANANDHVRLISHRARFGQSAALLTGIEQSDAEFIITLDADGQNDPADIPTLTARMTDEVDAVCGLRVIRSDTLVRRISSRIANRFRRWIVGDRFSDSGCNLRVMRRSALQHVPHFNGLHRFIPVILESQGFRVIETAINHRPRTWGTSKYGVGNRMWRGIADCLAIRWWKKRVLPPNRTAPGPSESAA